MTPRPPRATAPPAPTAPDPTAPDPTAPGTTQRANVARREAQRVSAARVQMLDLHPFWGYLLLQVRLVPAPHLGAFAATDCVRTIWYNPLRTQHLSLPQLGFVLAHEVGHQLFATEPRRRGRVTSLWNCATDFAINRVVAQIEHPARPRRRLYEPPEGTFPELGEVRILLDKRWDGMIAEAIYEYLAAETLPDPVSVTVELEVFSAGGTESTKGTGAAGGRPLRIPNVTDHGGGVDIHLPGDLTPLERDALPQRLGAAVDAALRSGRPGDVPAEALRQVRLARRPRVPWGRVFRRYVGAAVAQDDYSRRHPNRRYLEQDLVVPGLYSERLGTVVVAVDTSSSMRQDDLDAVASELAHLADLVDDLTLLVADTAVRQVVTGDDVVPFLREGGLRGGGGTDHRPVFAWVAQRRLRPDVFLGLTDLETILPPRPPPIRSSGWSPAARSAGTTTPRRRPPPRPGAASSSCQHRAPNGSPPESSRRTSQHAHLVPRQTTQPTRPRGSDSGRMRRAPPRWAGGQEGSVRTSPRSRWVSAR